MKMHRTFAAFTLATFGAALTGGAFATDLPKRKSGLWEIKTTMAGMPAQQGPMQACVDEKSDDLTQQSAEAEAQKNCSKSEVRRDGERYVIHSVCKFGQTTATTDGVFAGSFDSAYRADMKTAYNPPMAGMSEAKMSMEAKWLGPCKPGQKPGDVFLPGGMKINPAQMQGNRPNMPAR
jgi:Protein of unknown function (DUF3617)